MAPCTGTGVLSPCAVHKTIILAERQRRQAAATERARKIPPGLLLERCLALPLRPNPPASTGASMASISALASRAQILCPAMSHPGVASRIGSRRALSMSMPQGNFNSMQV
jgi:hypothetical protein